MNRFIGKHAYQQTALPQPKIEDAHGAISVCLETLINNLKVLEQKPEAGTETFNKVTSKCLTAIYILQSSLDFEKGQKIAESLFKLYEYVKQQIIANSKDQEQGDLKQSIFVMTEISETWNSIQ